MDAHEPVNILMVDDNPGKLLSYEAILTELGENLLGATSGREALAQLLTTEIAVVLMDVNMPELDGFELAAMIHEHPRYHETAILFISAVHLTDLDMLKGYEHGAVDYLTVPIIPALLRAKVRVFTELYRKTRQLARLNHELEQRMAELQQEVAERARLERAAHRVEHLALLGRLAAGVSHELRNPLAALFLHADLVDEELRQPSPDSPEHLAEAVAEIKKQLARVDELVQDYLSLARVSAIERSPQPLSTALHEWAAEWQQLARPRHVLLRLAGLDVVGTVVCHLSTLRRALLNLIQNAFDAMPHGGRLTVTGQRTASHIQLTVHDTGHGIPAAHLAHIFEPLYTTKSEGTGLGLYLAQEIVAAHGGHMTVESAEGQGTTFTVTLPCGEDPRPV